MDRYKLGMAALAGLVVGMACKEQIEDGVATVGATVLDTATTPAVAGEPSSCLKWRVDLVDCVDLTACYVDGAEPFAVSGDNAVTRLCIE